MTLNIATLQNYASLVVWEAVNDFPFFTPDSITSMQFVTLIDFSNAQIAYAQQIGLPDPALYTFEALGAALASQPNFLRFANIQDDTAFVTATAGYAFQQPESPAQIAGFVNQLHFLEGFYSAAHIPNYELVAKGAVFGLMLGVETELLHVPLIGISGHV
jgi:hypothetical protein